MPEEETITLSVNHTTPAEAGGALVLQSWAERIEERTEGRIDFDFYWSSSLLDIPDTVPGVADGRADISYAIAHHHSGYFPITGELLGMPFMGYPDIVSAAQIHEDLMDVFPEINEQFENAGVKPIYIGCMPIYQLFLTTTDEVSAPEDISGLDIIAEKRPSAQLINKINATPQEIEVGDWYMSLDRGVADGAISHFSVADAVGVLGLFEQHVLFGDQGFNMDFDMLLMNPDTYENLPEDLRLIFDEELEWFRENYQRVSVEETEMFMDVARDKGHIMNKLSEEEISGWEELAEPIHEEILEELEEEGIPANEIYEEIQKLNEEYQ